MKRFLAIFLGILTAIGGFVDIGELVAASQAGAGFNLNLAWAVVLSTMGIMIFGEMSGRVASVSHRPVFDVVRERMGPRLGLVNLASSLLVTLMTVAAEIAGVALALQLATSVNYLLWIPVAAFLVWLVIWRMNFKLMENLFGLLGLALVVVSVAVWKLQPDFGQMLRQVARPVIPADQGPAAYWYFAIALFGAGVMPYEVFFFSSGAVEEGWKKTDLLTERANVLVGFPLGAMLSLSIMAAASLVLSPRKIEVTSLYQSALVPALTLGKLGLAVALLGFFACTFGAALETSLSCGYMVAQYFGWEWGKMVKPRTSARFHLVILLCISAGALTVLTTIDPVKLTEFALALSAAALPLTYLPTLIVANDPSYMGDKTNSAFSNFFGMVFLAIAAVISIAAVPLLIITKAGG